MRVRACVCVTGEVRVRWLDACVGEGVRLCGCVAVRVCGCAGVRVPVRMHGRVCVDVRVCRCGAVSSACIRLSACAGVRVCGCMCMGVCLLLSACAGAWRSRVRVCSMYVSASAGARLCGHTGVQVLVFLLLPLVA
jgi:hypothetical protein